MNDADENQSTSGSWQPDPTGRYKLRWRNEAGDWTHHVYSEDGELSSDAYDSPSEPHPPPSPPEPLEPPEAEQSEESQPSDSAPRTVVCGRCGHTDFVVKRDRVLWHVCFWGGVSTLLLSWLALPFLRKLPYCARCGLRGSWLTPTGAALTYEEKPKPPIYRRWWAFVLYGFVILVVIANLVDDEDEESDQSVSAPSAVQEPPESVPATAAPTTTAPPTTAAPTTTAPPTTQPDPSIDDCAVRLELVNASFELITTFSAQMEAELAAGDLFALQETYDLTKWMMDDLPGMSRDFINDCGHLYPQSLVDESERAMEATDASWQFVQEVCRTDLAPFGFEC